MYLLYVTKIYILSLLKISYALFIGVLFIIVVMSIISLTAGDKYYFRKKFNKLRRWVFGYKTTTKQ